MNLQPRGKPPQPVLSASASIVLFHSCVSRLRATLRTLIAASEPLPAPLTLYVIDQSTQIDYRTNTTDICQNMLADANISLHFIFPASNKGYGAGHNHALARGLGDIHFILNPDVELDPSVITAAIGLMQDHPELALVAPRGFLPDGSVDRLAKRYPSLFIFFLRGFVPMRIRQFFATPLDEYEYKDLPEDQFLSEVTLVSGCCMIVKTTIWRKVGGFNTDYFLYFEDYDLSMRMAENGLVAQCSEIKIVHHGGGTAKKGPRHIGHFISGLLRFFNTWGWRLI